MRTEDLIDQLSTGLKPVKRVWNPAFAAMVWLCLAAAVIGAGVAFFGFRHDLAARLASGFDTPQLLSAAATGILAAFAAFQLALPDRDRRWALLPLPAAAAWLATMGWGCLADLFRAGPEALRLSTSFPCLGFIVGFGVPLTVGMLWLTRHAALIRPTPVAALGGLSAAALASVGLSLVHHLQAAAMVLAWHGMAIVITTLIASAIGPRLMRAGLSARAA
ncbi:DUF1109 domain-containing protein [Falsiroseomonas bella]|uniref:DUF1109 domain-containing protein n=1 Tax=Falsiroseomonas bella TaxID=2184016 RepID=A0A317FB04_9PROT|nr:NrsF family protein [Falsiroseomonas bella]PWS35643.1 DUF1109 domain-containing protein [Falsiroseomonas bella]